MGAVMGQGPKGVHKYITENLLPQAAQTRAEMQNEVDTAEKSVEQCGSLMWSAEKEVEHREKILLEDESGKYQCIAREHQLHNIEVDNCNDKVTFQQSLEPPVSINDASKTPQAMKEAITRNYEFYNTAYPEFVNKKGACDDAKAAAEAQLAECDADEAVIEEFYCKMKQGRDDACEKYQTCYDEKSEDMVKHIEQVQKLEEKVKEHFKEMSCFGGSFGEENKNVDECDLDEYSTNHLDVNYPQTPAKSLCVTLMNTRRDYTEIVCSDGAVVSGSASSGGDSSSGDGNSTSGDGNSSM
jgi:flagellar motility protein MotE (MotC chaperone)